MALFEYFWKLFSNRKYITDIIWEYFLLWKKFSKFAHNIESFSCYVFHAGRILGEGLGVLMVGSQFQNVYECAGGRSEERMDWGVRFLSCNLNTYQVDSFSKYPVVGWLRESIRDSGIYTVGDPRLYGQQEKPSDMVVWSFKRSDAAYAAPLLFKNHYCQFSVFVRNSFLSLWISYSCSKMAPYGAKSLRGRPFDFGRIPNACFLSLFYIREILSLSVFIGSVPYHAA